MTLNELKQDAELAAVTIDLNWDKLEDPQEAKYFVDALTTGMTMIPELEVLYTKLTSGKSVLFPDEDTPLQYDDLEQYTELVAEELHAAYIIQSVYDKYEKVNNIIALSESV
jgi:hypothetical protein